MKKASSEEEYKKVAADFRGISGYSDADTLADQCLEKAETCRKNEIYNTARGQKNKATVESLETAIQIFGKISGWKDADEQINICRHEIEKIKDRLEAERVEKERQQKLRQIAAKKAAKKRKIIISIVAILAVASVIAFFLLTKVVIPNSKYNAAMNLYNEGKYEEAISSFEALGGYKDSAELIYNCKQVILEREYDVATELLNSEKYDDALSAFMALDGYRDSSDQITKCELAIKDIIYTRAVNYYNEENYNEALVEFESLGEYKDSTDKAAECLSMVRRKKFIGSTIIFGHYEQDNNTSNGKEEIEWIIFDVEDGKALIVSKYALDCRPYNNTSSVTTWKECGVRKWLNETFYNVAFDADQKEKIFATDLNKYSKAYTSDKVFLLGYDQLTIKSDNMDKNIYMCQGTAYCYANGAAKDANGNCRWWLRKDASNPSNRAPFVNSAGKVVTNGNLVHYETGAVRPALWIEFSTQ